MALTNNKLTKERLPIISKDDNRKSLRSKVLGSNFSKQKEFTKLVRQWKEETEGCFDLF